MSIESWGKMSRMQFAVRSLLGELGEDPKREGLVDTPKRVANALLEMTSGYDADPVAVLGKTFKADYDQLVVVRGIEFWSTCEHHLLPFHGFASVGYLPAGKVVGLSKIPRALHILARRLQLQERLTQEMAEAMERALKPRGVGVLIRAEHLCMRCRGARATGSMVTSALSGKLRLPETRAEFFSLANS